MEQNKGHSLIIPFLCCIIALLALCSGVLFFEKNKAEHLAEEYKSAYDNLVVENEKTAQLAEENKSAYDSLVMEYEKIKQAEREKEEKNNQYEQNLRTILDLMFDGGIIAENCGNVIQSVWNNSIYKIQDSESDMFTLDSNGDFLDDFNEALDGLYNDKEFGKSLSLLSDNQEKVTKLMRDLKNPPEEWKDAYSDLLIYYDVYFDFTELMLHTNCSLNEFKEFFEKYDRESVKYYKKMGIYLS